MGLDVNGTKGLLYAKSQGVSFAKIATIGRLKFYTYVDSFRKNLSEFGFDVTDEDVRLLLRENNGYVEPFFKMLGSKEICSFDTSNYENSTYVHDFNLPIAETFKNRFTTVLDGGTLEHIFNFPVAIKNCMEMLEIGGHFIGFTPTNNVCGHGFYQFSPELVYRVFSEINGFKVEKLILFEDVYRGKWYEVPDPAVVQKRVTLVNTCPTHLFIIAQKVADVPIFATIPQQSDYVTLWDKSHRTSQAKLIPKVNPISTLIRKYKSLAPASVKLFYSSLVKNPRYPSTKLKRVQIP